LGCPNDEYNVRQIRNFTNFGILLFCVFPATAAIESRDTRALGFVVMRLLLTAFVGAIVGAATGYAVAAASDSPDSAGIIVWSTGAHLGAMDTILWAILGAGIAAKLSYFRNR
jgi:hypothetical protein